MKRTPLIIGIYPTPRGRHLASLKRPRRSRRCALLFLSAMLLLGGLLVAGSHWFLTAPVFAVSRVESGPYRFSSAEDVETVLSACLGRNIWTLSQSDVIAFCSGLPWVREVRLKRRVPDTVIIEFIEWQPLLVVAGQDEPYDEPYLIGDGRLLALHHHQHPLALPLLVGARVERTEKKETQLVATDARAVLAVVDALAASGLESACPVDFVRMTPEGVVLVLYGQSGSLLLGHDDFQLRLARFLLARPRIPEGSIVDLRFEDRITFLPAIPART